MAKNNPANSETGALKLLGAAHAKLVFGRRVQVLAAHLGPLLPPQGRILDVGCGDGSLDRLIMDQHPVQIEGLDVLRRPHTHIPVTLFDGTHMPYADNSVDAVLFVDVLHHTPDPMQLLREAQRVARRCVVIKDHCADGWLAVPTLRFMDWVGNAPHGVVLPYHYWTEQRWREAFASLSLSLEHWQPRLGLYPPPAAWLFERQLHFVARLAVV